jgi:hypothetical protein
VSGWYLQQLSIEGLRGINNEGAPLILKFKPDCVNSVSALNGVGKTSVFDAISYAITGPSGVIPLSFAVKFGGVSGVFISR